MKISKKQAIKFAIIEEDLRNPDGHYHDNGHEHHIPTKDYVLRENLWKPWQSVPAGMIATMLYDGIFPFQYMASSGTEKDIEVFKRKFGARLWNAGVTLYLLGDHDT